MVSKLAKYWPPGKHGFSQGVHNIPSNTQMAILGNMIYLFYTRMLMNMKWYPCSYTLNTLTQTYDILYSYVFIRAHEPVRMMLTYWRSTYRQCMWVHVPINFYMSFERVIKFVKSALYDTRMCWHAQLFTGYVTVWVNNIIIRTVIINWVWAWVRSLFALTTF